MRRARSNRAKGVIGSAAWLATTVTFTLFAACASFGEDRGSSGAVVPDGSASADGSVAPDAIAVADAAPVMRVCKVGAAFLTSGTMVSLDPAFDVESARLRADGQGAYVALYPQLGNLKNQTTLYQASVGASGAFGPSTPLPGFNPSQKFDSSPTVSGDGLHLVFASNRDAVLHLWACDRTGAGLTDPFDAPRPLTLQAPLIYADAPYLLANGTTMYFAAATSSATDYNIYRSSGISGPSPSYATNTALRLKNLSNSNESAPVVTEDEQELFYASDQGGGAYDIWTMQHTPGGAPEDFQGPTSIGILATPTIEYPVWISPDACDLYFIRKNGAGEGKLFVVHRMR